uniref:Myb-like protein X n=1 Tax=Rhizophora mucronata TaxID=61149 RepID=A0A2P2JJR1_RHIMU
MIKRTPNRNSRSRGIKVTHVLQVCLLLGVCFWLIYQVKHSHDKKKEFDEKDAKASIKAQSADEVLRFGRKGLHPHVQEASRNEKHEEDEEEEKLGQEGMNREEENKHDQEQEMDEEETKHEGEHKGGNKHEEEEREDENNHEEGEQDETKDEETEDEDRGGDDDIDESNQEKMDGEDDGEEEFIEEEKETEEVGEEKESKSNEAEGKEQVDHEKSLEDQDHEGNSHEAREENYRADDASSAVTHDVNGDLVQENQTNENNAYNVNGDKNNSTLHLEQGVMAENVLPGYNKDADVGLANTDDKSPPENTTSLFIDQQISSNRYLEVSAEADDKPRGASTNTSDLSQQNETLTISNPNHAQNSSVDGATIEEVSNLKYTELGHINNTDSDNSQSDMKAVSLGKPEAMPNSSSSSVSDASDKTIKREVEAEADANANAGSSWIIKEVTDATLNENSNTNNESNGTNEKSDSFATVEIGAADKHEQIDFSDTSIGQDEKEARKYLDKFPKDIVGGVNGRDAAAE